MTWQTTLYFISILLTIGLTGFLAWYAWRQGGTAGARAFMWLMVCDCALALTEALSMLSRTQTQAVFWFDQRFLPAGLINVLWLIFALEYTGRRSWLSKRLVAAMFVIPIITPVMVWSNAWHGLWVRHNVGFHQNGPLWIAETSARILGPWFLVHLFYGYIFLLTGSVLIIIAAWRQRRVYRAQAFFLAAGTFIPFLVALIPTFNLNPKAEFNPFVQGLGLGALFIAAAVFRFEFLKHALVAETSNPRLMAAQEKRSQALFVFILALMITGIAATGYVSYLDYERQFRMQIERQLSAIAELKVNELVNWRSERLGDAAALYQNPAFAALVQRYLENPADILAQAQLQAWLDSIQANYGYERVFLLDTGAVERISAPAAPEPVTAYTAAQAGAALAGGKVTFLDFHRDSAGGPVHLALLVPIFAGQAPDRPLGVLVLRIDPGVYLYPYINRWPAPSATAETLLVRRDGEDVVYLNATRFEPDAALNLRFPLARTDLAAAKAVLGQSGVVDGVDYRGMPVVAYMRAVPGSPWFLVAKMDSAEVYAPLRARAWQSVIFFGALIIAAGVGLVLVWRQQRLRVYREQVEAAELLRMNEEKLRILFEIIPVGISVLDAERKITLSNPALQRVLHITQAGLDKGDYTTRKYLGSDGTPMPAEEFASKRAAAEQKAIHNVETGVVTEDGEIIWTEVSAIPTSFSDWKVVIVTTDITGRKRAEEALQRQNNYLFALQETALDLISQLDLDTLLENIVKRAGQLMGTTSGSLDLVDQAGQLKPQVGLGALAESLQHVVKPGEGMAGIVWQTGTPLVIDDYDAWSGRIDTFNRNKLAAIIGVPLLSGSRVKGVLELAYEAGSERTFGQGGLEILTQFARLATIAIENAQLFTTAQLELTQRKLAENAISQEKNFNQAAIDSLPGLFYLFDDNGHYLRWNKNYEDVSGYSAEEISRMSPVDFFVEPDKSIIAEAIQLVFTTGKVVVEGKFVSKNRTQTPYFFTGILFSFEGKPCLIGMGIDITERKRAENLLRSRLELLEFAVSHSLDELLVKTLDEVGEITGSPIGFYHFVDSDQQTLSLHAWSTRTVKEFCKVEGNALHSPISQAGIWADCILTRKPVIHNDYAAQPHRKGLPEGHGAIIRELVVPILRSGKIVAILGVGNKPADYVAEDVEVVSYFADIAWEIAERKQADEILKSYSALLASEVEQRTRDLRETQEQLVRQERLATLGQMAGSVGHELRNPLGVISNAIYFLKLIQPDADHKVKEYLNIVEKETFTADKIVTDLLDFTRIKSVERELVDVSELVRQTLVRFPASPGVEVAFELPADLPPVYADPRQMVQILGNLTINACQAMPTGGKLTIAAHRQEQMVAITVKDSGVGISAENLRKLFEPLFTTKLKGIGLGLAVSKKLAEANDGRIEVESEIGKGSTFSVYLPAYMEP